MWRKSRSTQWALLRTFAMYDVVRSRGEMRSWGGSQGQRQTCPSNAGHTHTIEGRGKRMKNVLFIQTVDTFLVVVVAVCAWVRIDIFFLRRRKLSIKAQKICEKSLSCWAPFFRSKYWISKKCVYLTCVMNYCHCKTPRAAGAAAHKYQFLTHRLRCYFQVINSYLSLNLKMWRKNIATVCKNLSFSFAFSSPTPNIQNFFIF